MPVNKRRSRRGRKEYEGMKNRRYYNIIIRYSFIYCLPLRSLRSLRFFIMKIYFLYEWVSDDTNKNM